MIKERGGKEYRGLRTKRYTYVRDRGGPWLFYDNENDPYRTENLVHNPGSATARIELDRALAGKLEDQKDEFLPGMDKVLRAEGAASIIAQIRGRRERVMIKGLAHVCLSAKDLQETERFYSKGLGLEKKFVFTRKGRIVGYYFEISPGAYIEVFEHNGIEPDAEAPIRHFCLETDNIDEIASRLKNKGYRTTQKKLGADGSWQMWTTDPAGTRIEFHQYTDNSSQVTGENCALE
ncbi:MAG: VOC family protein [Kiritimatiellia bacterium]